MTDNEIKKALECKIKFKCNECPYFDGFPCSKCHTMLIAVLDLINRLEAENKKLQTVKKFIDTLIHRDCEYPTPEAYEKAFQRALEQLYDNTNLKAENERLTHITRNLIGEIKAEAYTEFAEDIKATKINHKNFGEIVFVEDIDNLLKEMVGEGNVD